ncbi:hypothetical protein A5724_21725 [Mycobacterium sp. ACS1612]|uniref:Hsp70 family protein n=1 Tax=Mycobacterium sp. ACS1612 TaxID=1834117 RepID=UPI0007FE3951|nr:Hsp70 family protein [Mycobacterium sp. ACS1612]OBF31589.1 hypothetical protein A5724_21725 [Mycobacterium sp. ACS1612]
MSNSLGLSVGMTNLAAVPSAGPPVLRRSILTLFHGRPPEVGAPDQRASGEHGMVLAGFVERVGDPIPLVAADGSTHRPGRLLVEALNSLAHLTGNGRPPENVAISVPAHWDSRVTSAFYADVSTNGRLCEAGASAQLISDATAALSAVHDNPGLPSRGVVALLDLGGTGTNITLSDAASGWAPIVATVRDTDFAGQQIDQAVLARVLAGVTEAANIDPDSTGAVLSLSRLRDQCRNAKETLSAQTVATLTAELPGFRSNVRLTRTELEDVLAEPLRGLLTALEDTLDRNRIPVAEMVAIATVGGGANIPLVTQRLSQHFRIPVVTCPRPELAAAAGAALITARGPAAPATTLTPAAALAAASAATDDKNPASQTFRALAWSEDVRPDDGAPYAGQADDGAGDDPRPQLKYLRDEDSAAEETPLAWYRRPTLLFGAAAAAVLLAGGGLTYTLTSSSGQTSPAPAPAPATSVVPVAVPPQAPPAAPAPGVVQGPAPVIVRQAPAPPRRVQQRPAAPQAPKPAVQPPPPEATSTAAPTATSTATTTSATPTTTEPTSSQPPTSSAPVSTEQTPVSTPAEVATPEPTEQPSTAVEAPTNTQAPVDTPQITIPQFTLPPLPGV